MRIQNRYFSWKPFLYVLYIKTQLSKLNCLWLPIILIQILQTMFVLLYSETILLLSTSSDRQDQLQTNLSIMFTSVYKLEVIEIITIVFFVMSMVLIIGGTIYMVLKKNQDEFDDKFRVQKKIIEVSAGLIYIYQASFGICTFNIKLLLIRAFQGQLQQKQYLLYLLPVTIIGSLFIILINKRFRLLAQGWILVPILLTGYWEGDQSNIIYNDLLLYIPLSIVGMICLVQIFLDEESEFLAIYGNNIRKIGHWIIFTVCIWKLAWTIQTKSQIQIANVVYLLIIIFLVVICTGLGAKRRNKNLADYIRLCQLISKLAKGSIKDYQRISMLDLAINISTKVSIKQNNNEHSFKKLSQVIKEADSVQSWRKFADQLAQYEYKQQSTLQTGLTIIKMKIITNDKLSNVLSFFKQIVTRHTSNTLADKYQTLKVAIKINQIYFNKHEFYDIPLVQIIEQVNKLRDQFYKGLIKSVDEYIQFWDLLPRRSVPKIQEKITFLSKTFQNSSQILDKIEKYSTVSRERNVLSFFIQKIFNYSNQEQSSEFTYQHQKQGYQEIFSVKDTIIDKISAKLARQLKYETYEIKMQSVCMIIPKYFYDRVQQLVQNTQSHINQIPFMLPLMCSDGSFALRNATCYTKVNMDVGYTFLFCLQRNISDKMPALIYQKSSNLIKGFNTKFVQTFEVNRNQVQAKINNLTLNLQDIFSNLRMFDGEQKNITSDVQKQHSCVLNIDKSFSTKKKHLNINVKLSIIQKYDEYLLIRVAQENSDKSLIINYHSKSMISDSIIHDQIDDNYDSQIQNGTYCPIQNPYKLKLALAKNNLRKKKNMNIPCLIQFCLILSLLSTIVFSFVGNQLNKETKQALLTIVQDKQQTWDIIKKLYLGYEAYYERFLYNQTEHELLRFEFNPDKIQKILTKKQQQTFKQFKKQFFEKQAQNVDMFRKGVREIKIDYKNFNISITENGLNLMDFAQKLFIKTDQSSIEFNLRNYKNLRKLWKYSIEQEATFQETKAAQAKKMIILIICCAIILIPSLFVSIYLMKKLGDLLRQMEQVLFMMKTDSKEAIKNKFQKIESIIYDTKSNRLQKKNDEKKTKNRNRATKSAYHKSKKNIYQQQIKYYHQDKLNQLDSQNSQTDLQDYEKMQKTQQVVSDHPSYSQTPHKEFRIQLFVPLLFLVAFGTGITFFFIFPIQEIQQYNTVYQFIAHENQVLVKVIQSQTNILHQIFYEYTFAKQDPITQSNIINYINEKPLQQQNFEDFQEQLSSRNSRSLCEYIKSRKLQFEEYDIPSDLCGKVLGQILNVGLPKSLARLNQIYNQVRTKGIHFLCEPYSFDQYPLIFQLNMGMDLAKIQIQEYADIFQEQFLKYRQFKVAQNEVILIATCAFIGVGILILISLVYFARKNSQICIGYFLIVQNQSLLNSDILKYIRDKQILQKLDKV